MQCPSLSSFEWRLLLPLWLLHTLSDSVQYLDTVLKHGIVNGKYWTTSRVSHGLDEHLSAYLGMEFYSTMAQCH